MGAANPEPHRRVKTAPFYPPECSQSRPDPHPHTHIFTSPLPHSCLTLTPPVVCATERERGGSTGLQGDGFIYWLMLVFPNRRKSPRRPSVARGRVKSVNFYCCSADGASVCFARASILYTDTGMFARTKCMCLFPLYLPVPGRLSMGMRWWVFAHVCVCVCLCRFPCSCKSLD